MESRNKWLFLAFFSEFIMNSIHYPKSKLETQSKTSLPSVLSLALLPQDEVGDGEDEGEDERNPGQDVTVPVATHCFADMELGGVNGGCYHDTQACRTGEGHHVTQKNLETRSTKSSYHMIRYCFYNK